MPRYFAIIPAAGTSSRMGQPKLLLPLAGKPVILHTIAAWRRSRVDRIAMVIRSDDGSLIETVRDPNVDIVLPTAAPPDMKSSVQAALRHIQEQYEPSESDAFLIAPADMPRLSGRIVDRLIEQHGSDPASQILVPTLSGKRGHPVLFPWSLAAEVHALTNEGLDWIVHHRGCLTIACDELVQADEDPFTDLDTPSEYQALQAGRFE